MASSLKIHTSDVQTHSMLQISPVVAKLFGPSALAHFLPNYPSKVLIAQSLLCPGNYRSLSPGSRIGFKNQRRRRVKTVWDVIENLYKED